MTNKEQIVIINAVFLSGRIYKCFFRNLKFNPLFTKLVLPNLIFSAAFIGSSNNQEDSTSSILDDDSRTLAIFDV